MLDMKRVGLKIATLRKGLGYSQEKLADMLCISPQAISKWENGHTLPETSLLPVLAQIFDSSIDDIIMPAYSFEEKILILKNTPLDHQAEQIANRVIEGMEDKGILINKSGLSDHAIIDAVHKASGNVGVCTIRRQSPNKADGNIVTGITASSAQKHFDLIGKQYGGNSRELYQYGFISGYLNSIPQLYHIDFDKKVVLKEDLSKQYVQGFDYDKDNKFGIFIRKNYQAILKAAAKWHAAFWENHQAFEKIGLDWRLESKENLVAHISTMEKDFKKYKRNEESGEIPKVWQTFENHMDLNKLQYFDDAIKLLKNEYVKLIETRFHTDTNITIIHGNMHPGAVHISKENMTVKFDGLQAVRMGICTEDLAMLIALHIEPVKEKAMPLLDYYYSALCETVKDYPYEIFISDYRISIMENMFFTIKLMNSGTFDFHMRDKAMSAFETFLL